MNLTNYHCHCSFCDGRASFEQFVQAATEAGFTSFGMSSHAPLPFHTLWTMEDKETVDAYLKEFRRIKDTCDSRMELYAGMEIDYLNEDSNPSVPYFQNLPLDYRIGSVHLLYDSRGEVVDIDCSPEKFGEIVRNHFNGDLKRVVCLYYERLMRMIERGGFDILGHADKIHYNASRYLPDLLDEPWYDSLMTDYFNRIAASGCMVEINTKFYLPKGIFFPNQRYFGLLKELRVPVLVNSDAHFPEKINDGRSEALTALRAAGYTSVMALHNGQWQAENIQGNG